jgi:hypothetical protein
MLRVLARSDNLAGDLQPKDVGRACGRRVKAATLENVGPVHAREGNTDENFACPGRRDRSIDQREPVGTTALRRDDRLHGGWQS